jgi:parallel beta-helix repeat protein
MKINKLKTMSAVVIAAALFIFGASAAQAATINVPADYPTIQAAINAATANDTIIVAAGTYTEQISVNKNLTLTGADSDTTIIQAPAVLANDPDGAKTVVLFTGPITAWISGFTIQGPVNGLNFGIYVRDRATANIHDNTVKDIRDEPLSGNQYGYGIEVGKYHDTPPFVDQIGHATITGNTVLGYQKTGIECEGAGSSATITRNTVTGAGPIPTTSQNGIQIRRGATGSINTNTVTGNAYDGPTYSALGIGATFPGNGVLIQGNIVNHNSANIYCWESNGVQILDNQVSDRATVDQNSSGGIMVESLVGLTGITISGNTVQTNLSGGGTQSDGIDLYGINSATVSGNVIVGSGYDGIWIGNSGNISITGNTFSDNGWLVADPNAAAIDLGNGAPNPLGGFSIHENSFVGNRYGIYNYDIGSVNATCNWWGAADGPGPVGPGSGDKVSTNVIFAPWEIAPGGACIGGNVPTNKDQCKNGGWTTQVRADGSIFRNQGDCIQYVNTGR